MQGLIHVFKNEERNNEPPDYFHCEYFEVVQHIILVGALVTLVQQFGVSFSFFCEQMLLFKIVRWRWPCVVIV